MSLSYNTVREGVRPCLQTNQIITEQNQEKTKLHQTGRKRKQRNKFASISISILLLFKNSTQPMRDNWQFSIQNKEGESEMGEGAREGEKIRKVTQRCLLWILYSVSCISVRILTIDETTCGYHQMAAETKPQAGDITRKEDSLVCFCFLQKSRSQYDVINKK